jgi:hypothetical protein
MKTCRRCDCPYTRTGPMDYQFAERHRAFEELGVGPFKIDVGVMLDQRCVAALEVYYTHKVDRAKRDQLEARNIPVIEVVAEHVIGAFEEEMWLLAFYADSPCKPCTEQIRKQTFAKQNRPCYDCGSWRAIETLTSFIPPETHKYPTAYRCNICALATASSSSSSVQT